MTGDRDVSRETSAAWITYREQEQAARDMYLLVTARAHHEYLTGPWPDRGAYEVVERQAWNTYYAAGRGAWGRYQAALETTAAPGVGPAPDATEGTRAWAAKMGYRHPRPAPAAHPYPMSDESALSAGLLLRHEPDALVAWDVLERRYGPNCPECGIPWRQPSPLCPRAVNDVHPRQPAFTPHPGNGQPGEPDQWPGNYLAADPDTRDGQ